MRIEVAGNRIHVWLSERNLLALLTKLSLAGSVRSIVMDYDADGIALMVTSETDEVHYGNRDYPPGRMIGVTEEMIRNMR